MIGQQFGGRQLEKENGGKAKARELRQGVGSAGKVIGIKADSRSGSSFGTYLTGAGNHRQSLTQRQRTAAHPQSIKAARRPLISASKLSVIDGPVVFKVTAMR